MTPAGRWADSLLVSSANDGGVLLLSNGVPELLSVIDTTGISIAPGGVLLARQSSNSNQLRRWRDGQATTTFLSKAPLDLHDVLWHGDLVYVVSTEINAVIALDPDLVEVQRWTLAGEPDSAHVNSVCIHEGRLLASRFGQSTAHRGYKGASRGAGEVYDVQTGEVVLDGLSQPHSLTSHDGDLWLCDSEAHRVACFRGNVLVRSIPVDGYVRGLAFAGGLAYAGLSRSRNDPDNQVPQARVVRIDLASSSIIDSVGLAVDEVYDIRVYSGDEALLRASALAEANALVADGLRQLDERDQQLMRVHGQLGDARAQGGQLTAQLAHVHANHAGLAAELVAAKADGAEQAAWASLLQAEAVRLEERLLQQEAIIPALQASRADWRATAQALLSSRSWRITGVMRALARALGRPAGIPLPSPGIDPAFEPMQQRLVDARAALPIFGLVFDDAPAPEVSIVVTAYGSFEATLACLRSIQGVAPKVSFEVILIEDASGDIEMERFRSVEGLRYTCNPVNLGYLQSSNLALHLARGKYLHFLNNDTVVQYGWLDALLQVMARFPSCGLVGSRLVYPDGRLQEAGAVVWNDGNACNIGRGGDAAAPEFGYVHEVDYASGASLLVPADLFRACNGFDTRFAPAYYEDTDLAFRVRAAGRQVHYQPASVVVHHEGLSHGTDALVGIKAGQGRNQRVFADAWRDELDRGQWAPGEHMWLARDRAQLKKCILVVDRCAPRTDRDAGSRAIWQLLRVLSLQGLAIKFWSHETADEPEYTALLQSHGIEVLNAGSHASGFDGWIADHGRYLDYVVLSRPMVAVEYIDAIRRNCVAPLVFYGHDVHHLRFMAQYRLQPSVELDGFANYSRDVETRIWRSSDAILYPSDSEAAYVDEWLRANDGNAVSRSIPLFAYEMGDDVIGAGLGERRNILFVGGFAHAPNADGAEWFVRTVWPTIHHHHPEYRLCLVGADPPPSVLALAGSGVLVTGHVPESELLAYYASSRVVVAPLRFGAGVKGKVLEAMRQGVPCVMTSSGAQGLVDASFLRVADDPQDMARLVIDLLRMDDEWLRAAEAGLAFVRTHFSVESVWRVLAEFIDPAQYPDVATRRARIQAIVAATVPTGDGPPAADG